MAVFILIYRSHSYRWAAVVPRSNGQSWALSRKTHTSRKGLGIALSGQRVYSHTFTYPAKTITDADYADDIALLAITPNQAETLLHNLERAAADIGLHVNAHKTEYMCYNQTGDISTLDGTSLKLVDKFTYLGSSVSSTEKDIDTRLTKAWTAIDRLSIIWKSDLTDKMKRSYFQAAVVSILLYGGTTWTLTRRQLHKNCWEQYWTISGGNTPQATNYTATYLPSRKLYKLDEAEAQDTARLATTNSSVMYSYGPPHMAKQKQDDQLEHTYRSYARIRDVALKTCQREWMIGRSGERGSEISVLAARHDDVFYNLWFLSCSHIIALAQLFERLRYSDNYFLSWIFRLYRSKNLSLWDFNLRSFELFSAWSRKAFKESVVWIIYVQQCLCS